MPFLKCFVQYKLMLNLFYRMKHLELRGIHRWIVHVCAEKQSALKPRDAIGEKEETAFIAVSWRNTHISLPLPYRVDHDYPKISIVFIFRADNSLFLFILFLKIEFYIFSS